MPAALPTPVDKPRFVAAMFGRIARRYDLMNTLMTAGMDAAWRRSVASLVAATGAQDVLDVGTGTGKLVSSLIHALPRARVVGVDFAEPMLRASRSAAPLAAADGLALPFADASFDAVTSAFVLRNLADLPAGVAEQVRVLRAGGLLIALDTTPGPGGALRPLFRLYFRGVVPLLGQLIAGDAHAYTYLPESTAAFLEPERLADLFRASGLQNVSSQHLAFGAVAITSGRNPNP
jgi:demethylmenaquinone methyltransferase/2-methoxy-6-polyprenyl-1,4-benzoquinol methylase